MNRTIVVIGTGPAGLAVAAGLIDRGVPVTLLDRADAVGASWRTRYDGLRLNTVRWRSHLPGFRIPATMGRWVGRDDFVEYFELYAERHGLRLQANVTVDRIDPAAGAEKGWVVSTDRGTLEAAEIVVADGVVAALRAGKIQIVPGVAAFDGHDVLFANGEKLRTFGVIMATGYTPGLEWLAGHLGVLDQNNLPLAPGGGSIRHAGRAWHLSVSNRPSPVD